MQKTINIIDADGNTLTRLMTPEEEWDYLQMSLEEYEADMQELEEEPYEDLNDY